MSRLWRTNGRKVENRAVFWIESETAKTEPWHNNYSEYVGVYLPIDQGVSSDTWAVMRLPGWVSNREGAELQDRNILSVQQQLSTTNKTKSIT